MKEVLEQYRKELRQELEDILAYWMKFTIDNEHGGFVGKIDHDNKIYPDAPKGSVLNSRILWTFSAAHILTKKQEYLIIAERAFQYLLDFFVDKEFGGLYWTVDYKGQPLDNKKQIYALSFAVYGLSEFYRASKNKKALQSAIEIYSDILKHSYDEKNGGYIEALTRDWREINDLRLSAKDANEKKSMNTHLHVLEAFVNLHRVSPTESLKVQLHELIRLFTENIISRKTNHLVLFFDDEWNERSQLISYGHDIEAAWLVQEAVEVIDDKLLLLNVKERSLALAKAASEGLDKDGGLWYEYDPEQHHLIKQKHSWPQAEAMIGFFNAWQNTGDETYLEQSLRSWEFVKKYIHDETWGEWHWGVNADYSPMNEEDKVGIWKCPYHNSRACIEIINRINSIID
jgi:mannobiose 2-epimerase